MRGVSLMEEVMNSFRLRPFTKLILFRIRKEN